MFAVALTIQIQLEPIKRSYDDETRERLKELFGEPGRWATTARRMVWSTESVLVQTFTGSTSVEVPVLCNYDLELAATRYFSALPDGEVPLVWHFNGSVYYQGDDERLQIVPIPWDTVAEYQMPVAAWRQMIELALPAPRLGRARLRPRSSDSAGSRATAATTRSTRPSASCSTRPRRGARERAEASTSWSARSSTRATRSTRTRRAPPRTRPRPRSGSSIRRTTPRPSPPPSRCCAWSACCAAGPRRS